MSKDGDFRQRSFLLGPPPKFVWLRVGNCTPFDSGFIGPGETYSRRFTVPGRCRYFCIPHESQGMIGELIVAE